VAAVAAVRAAWPDAWLAVDWNGSAEAGALTEVDALGVAYHEQPAPADDLVASARWAAMLDAPVALDESIDGTGSLEAAIALGAGRLVNLKAARVGGLGVALAIVARLRELGLGWFVGGMVESGVGRAAALALAALEGDGTVLPTDLGPSSQYLDRDVTDPVWADGSGRLVVPTGAGIGVDVHPEVLTAVRTHHLELT
jgi:O-succinylbenzoate synthase